MLVQIGAETGGDGFRDLVRRKLDAALPHRMPHQWRDAQAAGLAAIEQRPHFSIAHHAVREAHPARPLARPEHRPNERENAGRLREHPGSAR